MPTLTATAVPTGIPHVALSLNWPAATTITINRLDPDGVLRPVRGAEPATLSGGLWFGDDYESWLGQDATYSATDGTTSVDSTTVSVDVDDVPWLRHPQRPALSMVVEPLPPLQARTHTLPRAVFRPLGREFPVVLTDGTRKAPSSAIAFATFTEEEAEEFRALFGDGAVLLMDVPVAYGLGFTHQYLSFGDLVEARFEPRYGPNPRRTWTAPYDAVDRTEGALQPIRTYADLLQEFSTYEQARVGYTDYADLLLGGA